MQIHLYRCAESSGSMFVAHVQQASMEYAPASRLRGIICHLGAVQDQLCQLYAAWSAAALAARSRSLCPEI